MFDCIVVGAGFAGAVIARELAEKSNKRVLIIEKRNHIAGNMYDCFDSSGILIHKYGPHIFHTYSKRVYEYLSDYTSWNNYQHEVAGSIDGKLVPIPFNLNTLKQVFDAETAVRLKEILVSKHGMESRIPILTLRQDENPEIRKVADYVYEKIFINYTMKQWGLKPEEIDPQVTARVPVHISFDNRYFQDEYQGLPEEGYTRLFERLLNHENITVRLNTNACDLIKIDTVKKKLFFEGEVFNGPVVYTGAIDELLEYRLGVLPYRSLDFKFETYEMNYYQPKGTVNYPNDMLYTRITEFKHLTGQRIEGKTTIVKEYPMEYNRTGSVGNIPFYPIFTQENMKMYNDYKNMLEGIDNLFLLGRLAEYKYYNMDAIVESALNMYNRMNV
ncbi:MAG TPA: UDP-galactopyranose mutase [Acetivibrio sp.]|nr:UDP-galactopyranose mutase [Clostridium sp.]HOQ36810.1 UDP-galactopyranose mutase [Acetivibrio sp.]HPT90613.1 UDP-galactopyranose mutase [Acetivibrio sp.]HQA57013.1 UDP-galactopyranose mutase [Acetivibrio sp.]